MSTRVEWVTAPLQYLSRDVDEPVVFLADSIPGKIRGPQTDSRSVRIYNGRQRSSQLRLDKQGFILRRHSSKVNFFDDEEVFTVHFPELENYFYQTTNAKYVIPYDFFVRTSDLTIDRQRTRLAAFHFIHSDFTDYFLRYPAPELLSRKGLPSPNDFHLVALNLWRPICGKIQRAPLAVCDAQSVAPDDLVETPQRRLGGTETHMNSSYFNPEHRWFYFPEMEEDEVLIFKSFDSRKDGRARCVLHASFGDPNTPDDAPARRSMDARVLLCFDKTEEHVRLQTE